MSHVPTEMELRVAKALHDVYYGSPSSDPANEFWIAHARAAIRAMYVPTRDILDAARDDVGPLPKSEPSRRDTARGRALAAWCAMIDAASPEE